MPKLKKFPRKFSKAWYRLPKPGYSISVDEEVAAEIEARMLPGQTASDAIRAAITGQKPPRMMFFIKYQINGVRFEFKTVDRYKRDIRADVLASNGITVVSGQHRILGLPQSPGIKGG